MKTAGSEEAVFQIKKEVMLQINQRLFDKKIITQQMYEIAKIKIVNGTV